MKKHGRQGERTDLLTESGRLRQRIAASKAGRAAQESGRARRFLPNDKATIRAARKGGLARRRVAGPKAQP